MRRGSNIKRKIKIYVSKWQCRRLAINFDSKEQRALWKHGVNYSRHYFNFFFALRFYFKKFSFAFTCRGRLFRPTSLTVLVQSLFFFYLAFFFVFVQCNQNKNPGEYLLQSCQNCIKIDNRSGKSAAVFCGGSSVLRRQQAQYWSKGDDFILFLTSQRSRILNLILVIRLQTSL